MGSVLFDKILGRVREDANGGGGGGSTPKIITVSDVHALTNEQCESLNAGDIVVVSNNGMNCTCEVTSKGNNTLYLCYIYGDNKKIIRAKYLKENNLWSFDSLTHFPLATPLYHILPVAGMAPNAVYALGELTSDTTFALLPPTDTDIASIWYWTFSTGATAPMITWPNQITMWADGAAPTIEANKYYEINVMDGLACVVSADVPQNN